MPTLFDFLSEQYRVGGIAMTLRIVASSLNPDGPIIFSIEQDGSEDGPAFAVSRGDRIMDATGDDV